MAKELKRYSIFIASPGGLDAERGRFRDRTRIFSKNHACHENIDFEPVGWEDNPGGIGRPQGLINDDLMNCDFALFIFHDRWGSPPGGSFTSGTEEEWIVARKLHAENRIKDISLFFKKIDADRLASPDTQMQRVLDFKKGIEDRRELLYKEFEGMEEFSDLLDGMFSKWLRNLKEYARKQEDSRVEEDLHLIIKYEVTSTSPVNYGQWMSEAEKCLEKSPMDLQSALIFSKKAAEQATTKQTEMKAKAFSGVCLYHLENYEEALEFFECATDNSLGQVSSEIHAIILNYRALTLAHIGGGSEYRSAFEQIINLYGTSSDEFLRTQVAAALLNKGVFAGKDGDRPSEIEAYETVIQVFSGDQTPDIKELVARAALYAAMSYRSLENIEREIKYYDVVLSLGEEIPREIVAESTFSKGVALWDLGDKSAISVYNDLIEKFVKDTEFKVSIWRIRALVNKAALLLEVGRNEEGFRTHEIIMSELAAEDGGELLEAKVNSLINQGVNYRRLGNTEKAVASYDKVISMLETAEEPKSLKYVAAAMVNKAIAFGRGGQDDLALEVYDEMERRFKLSEYEGVREELALAYVNKGKLLYKKGNFISEIRAYHLAAKLGYQGSSSRLEGHVCDAMVKIGESLIDQRRARKAIEVFNCVIDRLSNSKKRDLKLVMFAALKNKSIAQDRIGELRKSLKTLNKTIEKYSEIVAGGADDTDEEMLKLLFGRGCLFLRLDKYDDAIAEYDRIINHKTLTSDAKEAGIVAKAMANKATALFALDRNYEAASTLAHLMNCFVRTTNVEARGVVDDIKRQFNLR